MVPLLSIVIPVHNESENVFALAEETASVLKGVESNFEIVFVDDASSDDTWEQVQIAQKKLKKVRGFRLEQQKGQSGALWTGIQGTESTYIATMDGDRQNDPNDIPKMLEIVKKDADFVCGWRKDRQDTWERKMASWVARRARNLILKADFHDTGCAMRVFKRECIKDIWCFDGLHRFLPILVHAEGYRTIEIPVGHRERTHGLSKYGILDRLRKGIPDLFAMSWIRKRIYRPSPFTELKPLAAPKRKATATKKAEAKTKAPAKKTAVRKKSAKKS